MISHLKIQGLALIDELSIDFSDGFNVLTGETGAGKSILIRALNFLIGAKSSAENVRKGYDAATVEAHFLLPVHHPATQRLETLGIPLELSGKEHTLLIRRNLNLQGRSQAWINDHSVTLASLKHVGEVLIDVFGQHENQRLLNPKCHLDYVDRFLKDEESVLRYQSAFSKMRELMKGLETIVTRLKRGGEDREYLEFKLKELESFEPTLDDFKEVKRISEEGSVLLKGREKLERAAQVLEGERSVAERLWESRKMLQALQLESLQNEAGELASRAESLHFEISKMLQGQDVDEDRLEEAQQRVYGYQKLLRKYHVREVEELILQLEDLKKSLASKEVLEAELAKVLAALEKQTSELESLNLKLSKQRLEASARMKKAVETELKDLSMAGARFGVNWKALETKPLTIVAGDIPEAFHKQWTKLEPEIGRFAAEGTEHCEFLLGANAGEDLFPLSKVASGGELSRIMLALKKALSVDAETCVLVFDEIDTGISGRVADVVGKKLRELSADFQVICISHLPQVAVYADTHFLVEKKSGKGKESRTQTALRALSQKEREEEVARLLSGETVTKTSLENAKALIGRAHEVTATRRKREKNHSESRRSV